MNFEEILGTIGGFGKYQILILFLTGLPLIVIAFNHLSAVFIAAELQFICRDNSVNASSEIYKGKIPLQRSLYVNSSNECVAFGKWNQSSSSSTSYFLNITTDCTEWLYEASEVGSTIVSQWDLVCSRQWLVSVSTSVYMAGLLVGLMPIAVLTDKYGRRKMILVSMVVMTTLMYGVPLSPNIFVFMVCRFFAAFFAQGLGTVSYCFALESVSSRFRLLAALVSGVPWVIGIQMMVGFAYWMRNWQHLYYSFAGISTLFTLICLIMLPESIRWLYATGNDKLGDEMVVKMARINNQLMHLPESLRITVSKGAQKANCFDLVRTPEMRKRTVIVCYLWFVASLVYFGLYFNSSKMSLNVYVNMCLAGVFDLCGSVAQFVILTLFGRKRPGIAVFSLAGVCLLVSLAFNKGHWMVSALSIAGRGIIGVGFGISYIFSAELTPTVLRSNGLSAGSVFARLGGIVAPFIGHLDDFNPVISSCIFGIMSVSAGMLICLLPETKATKLPDTVSEVESVRRSIKTADEPLGPVLVEGQRMVPTSKKISLM